MQHQHPPSNNYEQSDCTLNPGEPVAQSGVYEICHSDEPRTSLLLLRNSFFPFCRRCGDSVRFKLLQPAPHISEDPDFTETLPEIDNSLLNHPLPNHGAQMSRFPAQLGIAHGFRFLQDAEPA